ncbi:hypothetical protein [Flavivirga rizhaonensis]|uniref:Uncharacterized protein n=1 Tax=Flavivirga rizhaonensis TaxID=2559571 RepID=A0A4S1DYQ3_9FLAO|nr:hypothetical protein [Flavivirga rizhaonensis]TGV03386.1 hypothetical protein EM932_06855 [Flavivirga rizhaonensis]
MKNIIKIFTVLLIIALAILSFVDRTMFNDETEVGTLIDARKVLIENKDSKHIDSLINILETKIETNDKQISSSIEGLSLKEKKLEFKKHIKDLKLLNKTNTEKINKIIDELDLEDKKEEIKALLESKNEEIIDLNSSNLKSFKDSKNEIVFKYESFKIKDKPNIWLIILIILSAGIIGGWARTNYSLLAPLQNNIAELEKKMKAILEEIKGVDSEAKEVRIKMLTLQASELNENTESLAKEIKSVLDEIPDPSKRVNTSIVFGVIASSISILALKLTDSQVLDFADTIDYFILWAWCLLGAVYAKDTLERVYNNRFTKKE